MCPGGYTFDFIEKLFIRNAAKTCCYTDKKRGLLPGYQHRRCPLFLIRGEGA